MKRIDEIIEGLKIHSKYDEKGYSTEPGHDVIYSGKVPEEYTEEDAERLVELGWFIDSETDSWAKFT